MTSDSARLRRYITEFNFKPLFVEELGWEDLRDVAEKRGLPLLQCDALPPYAVRARRHISFSLEKEEELTLFASADRAKTAFDVERVTKKFYDCFQIDHILARHYGFTDEELNYILNYDIKVRLGAEDGCNSTWGRALRPRHCAQAFWSYRRLLHNAGDVFCPTREVEPRRMGGGVRRRVVIE
ncbi:MAG: hypothetical protein IPM07_13355 [Anaerolineales bacterium]|nr:hypothetical protein [Anaerolineales bacterium]